jgi:dipeptidyl aminopeptidase/acylaminoacyl peptidase
VFEPNYRGSDNMGDAYTQAIIGDVASGPGRDVLEGVAAVEKLGFVDTTRIGVSGWSGGGLQTTWLVGHSHIWKAAVAGAAVTNWVDQYSLADISTDFTAAFFGGSPWDPKYEAAYKAESPITYARSVMTPTLILSDIGDYRVPVSQSFEFYHALRDNGVEAKFVAMPRGGHFPGDPAGAENVKKVWIGWFEDHLK